MLSLRSQLAKAELQLYGSQMEARRERAREAARGLLALKQLPADIVAALPDAIGEELRGVQCAHSSASNHAPCPLCQLTPTTFAQRQKAPLSG